MGIAVDRHPVTIGGTKMVWYYRNVPSPPTRRASRARIGFSPNIVSGRFTVHTRHSGQPWEVIVEPDDDDELFVVITAYQAD